MKPTLHIFSVGEKKKKLRHNILQEQHSTREYWKDFRWKWTDYTKRSTDLWGRPAVTPEIASLPSLTTVTHWALLLCSPSREIWQCALAWSSHRWAVEKRFCRTVAGQFLQWGYNNCCCCCPRSLYAAVLEARMSLFWNSFANLDTEL